jgi:hypothetical protein
MRFVVRTIDYFFDLKELVPHLGSEKDMVMTRFCHGYDKGKTWLCICGKGCGLYTFWRPVFLDDFLKGQEKVDRENAAQRVEAD